MRFTIFEHFSLNHLFREGSLIELYLSFSLLHFVAVKRATNAHLTAVKERACKIDGKKIAKGFLSKENHSARSKITLYR